MANTAQSSATEKWWLQKSKLPLIVIALAVVIATTLLLTPPEIASTAKVPVPVSVRMVVAKPESRQLSVMSEGTVRPRIETKLIAQVAGEVKWTSDNLIAGGQFSAGEVLIRLDSSDYAVALKNAEAQLRQTAADKAYAIAEAKRIGTLHSQNLASISQLQLAERSLENALAASLSAEAALERAQLDMVRTQIVAPYAGRVRNEAVDIGQFMQKGAPVTTIYSTAAMEIKLPVPDAHLAFLDESLALNGVVGADLAIPVVLAANFAGREQEWIGHLVRTEGSIDERSRFIYLVAEVTETVNRSGTQLPVGLFVRAEIAGRQVDNVVALPRSSLRTDNQVMVIDANNTLHFRKVDVLRLTNNEVLVSGGLDAGERVSVSPLQFVVEGMPVTIVD
jgi:RND family efflux transporter MFP subunit